MYLLPNVCQVLDQEIMSYSLLLSVLIILWLFGAYTCFRDMGGGDLFFPKQIERGDKVLNFTLSLRK